MRHKALWLASVAALVAATAATSALWVWAGQEGKAGRSETKTTLDQVPEAVRATALKEAAGAAIKEVEVEVKNGQTVYEIEWVVGNQEIEIKVAPDGTVLSRETEEADDDDDDDDGDEDCDDGDDDDEDEVEVTLDQVPAAVKEAILKAAAGATIKEIEAETKNGQTVYEAEWVVDGKEIEITVSADGTILKREVEDADDD